MRSPIDKLVSHWVARSLAVGAVSTALDVAALLLLVRGLRLSTPLASALSVALGCAASFLLNKFLAFRDARTPLLPQAARYAATMAVAMSVHASLMYGLTERLGLHLLTAKLAADLLVFGCGSLWALRFVVFREAFAEGAPSLARSAPPSSQEAGHFLGLREGGAGFGERVFPRSPPCVSPPS